MLQRFAFGAAFTLALAFAAPGCAVLGEGTDSSSAAISQVPNQTDWARGTNWTYESNFQGLPNAWVYRPTSFSQKSPGQRGVIFHLGGCGVMTYQIAQGSGWPQAAEAAGMVIVIPDVIAPAHPNTQAPNVACYNFGAGLASEPTANSADHKAIIAAAKKITTDTTLKVDPRQVYVAGFSAGATVAMQVGCMAPDVFAGIGSVAGPSMGTNQSQSVMPTQNTSSSVQSKCTSYAGAQKAQLATQVYAVVSDNNGLPAGNPVQDAHGNWTADKFQKQTIWDGDKYVPHAHHDIITGAMASIFGVTKTTTGGTISGSSGSPFTGSGVGCPGGAASHDDTGETDCPFGHAVSRDWSATADIWTDSQGRKRIVHISQDTLRHRWPTGPSATGDVAVTPSMADLVSAGLFDTSTGLFDMDKVDAAPNGQLGALYFANDSFDFPMFFVDYLTTNNPRLPAQASADVAIAASATVSGTSTTVSGSVNAPGGAHVASIVVTFQGTDHAATVDTTQSSDSFSVTLDTSSLANGSYSATIKATDDAGHTATSNVSFTVGSEPPPPPPPPSGAQCMTAKNSAHVLAGRAYYGLAFHAYAVGSNTDLGGASFADDTTTSLSETSTNFWAKVDSCP